MIRRLSLLISSFAVAGSLALSLSSCNAPSCGPGTVQQQDKNGKLQCVAVDYPAPLTPCDVDAGNVMIVGGKCVSAIQCDPGSTMDINGVCVGSGMPGGASCRQPASGKACVAGDIYNFTTNTKASGPMHVALYDPLTLLMNGPASFIAQVDLQDAAQGYVFQDFTPPQLGLILIVTGTPGGAQVFTGTGAQGVGPNQYRVDAYSLLKTDSDKWGFDITAGGGQIAKYYNNPKPTATQILVSNDKNPVAGVTMIKDTGNANAKYFNDTLTAIDPMLTVTGTSGTAIVASPVSGAGFPSFTGMGPTAMPIAWESLNGGSAANLVIITRFHPNM